MCGNFPRMFSSGLFLILLLTIVLHVIFYPEFRTTLSNISLFFALITIRSIAQICNVVDKYFVAQNVVLFTYRNIYRLIIAIMVHFIKRNINEYTNSKTYVNISKTYFLYSKIIHMSLLLF